MKLRSFKFYFLLLVALVAGADGCAVEDGERPEPLTREVLESFDEGDTRAYWQWSIEQGVEPCEPPPDPWHPFVIYGLCGGHGDIEHEAVPTGSFDD